MSAASAQADSGAYTNGSVRAIAYDGNGGFYIGGDFTQVNGSVNQSYLVHVKSDATVDTNFLPTLNGRVRAMVLSSGKLYIGGDFTSVNSTTRNYVAALDVTNGTLDSSFNPNANGIVRALAVSGSNVYIGGNFTALGSTTRNLLGAVSTGGTLVSGFNPDVTGTQVNTILVNTNVYFGGSFTSVGGTARSNAASVNTSGALQTNWAPQANGAVNSIAFPGSGTTYYIGGDFTQTRSNGIGAGANTANTRNYAATHVATGTTGGTAGNWNPNFGITGGGTPSVKTISINTAGRTCTGTPPNQTCTTETVVFLGGTFSTVKGSTLRDNLVAMNATTTGSVLDLNQGAAGSYVNPNPNGTVNVLVAVGGIGLASGGDFTVSALIPQNYYAGPAQNSPTLATGVSNTPVDPAVEITKGEQVKGIGFGFYDAGGNQTSIPKWQRCTTLNNLASCTDMGSLGEKATNGYWYGLTNNDIGYQNRLKIYYNSINGLITTFSGLTGLVGVIASVPPEMDPAFCSYGPGNAIGDPCSADTYTEPRVGEAVKPVIRTSQGKWQGYVAGVSTLTAQWQSCTDVSDPEDYSSCTDIPAEMGGTSYWYTPRASDEGKGLRVTITLTTRGMSDSQGSTITPAVATTPPPS